MCQRCGERGALRKWCLQCSTELKREKLAAWNRAWTRPADDFSFRRDIDRWLANVSFMVRYQCRPERLWPAEFDVVTRRLRKGGLEHAVHALLYRFIHAPASLLLGLDMEPVPITEEGLRLIDRSREEGFIVPGGDVIEGVRRALRGDGLVNKPGWHERWGPRHEINGGAYSLRVTVLTGDVRKEDADREPRVEGWVHDPAKQAEFYLSGMTL